MWDPKRGRAPQPWGVLKMQPGESPDSHSWQPGNLSNPVGSWFTPEFVGYPSQLVHDLPTGGLSASAPSPFRVPVLRLQGVCLLVRQREALGFPQSLGLRDGGIQVLWHIWPKENHRLGASFLQRGKNKNHQRPHRVKVHASTPRCKNG